MEKNSPGFSAQLACVWEATARKPGNVHPYAGFADLHYSDFVLSATAISPILEKAPEQSIGETILQAVQATKLVVRSNTNLGIVLLLAPLAAVWQDRCFQNALENKLHELTVDDSRRIYQAIRLGGMAGLEQVEEQDIAQEPTLPFRDIMALAADRDLIARQYVNGFQEVFEDGLSALQTGLRQFRSLEEAILFCHLHLLSRHEDSLIVRKRGSSEARYASELARKVLELDWPALTFWGESEKNKPAEPGNLRGTVMPCHEGISVQNFQGGGISSSKKFHKLDTYLRGVGNGRNPGTTADLVTASLFVALRLGIIEIPLQRPWSYG